MAAEVASRLPNPSSNMGRPIPSPLLSSGMAESASTTSSSSPFLNSRSTPSAPSQPSTSAALTNGVLPRTRQRQRPSLAKLNSRGLAHNDVTTREESTLVEPRVRTSEWILRQHRNKVPSLILHLHPNHFRFDQQDGTFRYNSPMKMILEHIKDQTIPHNILPELFQNDVKFYDGCLIVEIHDHRTAANAPAGGPSTKSQSDSYSIHNYNEHITPSPYVPYPTPKSTSPESTKKDDNGEMPAPQRPSKAELAAKKTRVFTTVLHPTPLSLHAEMSILARTLAPEARAVSKRNAVRDSGTPVSAYPSTPLTAVPSTPGLTRNPAKRQKMMLEENDIHSFEAEVLRATEPPLYLEPAKDFQHAQDILKSMKHPLHNKSPSQTKRRERTATELAADEALAAEEEHIALIMDERLQPSIAAGASSNSGAASEGHSKAKEFEPNFSRFKMLEEIKRSKQEEAARKEEQDRVAAAQKRSEEQVQQQRNSQQAEENRIKAMHQNQALQKNREAAIAAHRLAQQTQQNANNLMRQAQMPGHMMQNLPRNLSQSIAAGQQGSPIMRNHTPMNSSPLGGPMMNNIANQQMAQVNSNQGAGSPARPPSGMQMHGAMPMARGLSHQSHPGQSHAGTPQMANSTPHMGQQMQQRNMTPQPGMHQSSPMVNGMHGTPAMPAGMMQSSQMNNTPLTPEQQARIVSEQQKRIQMERLQQQTQAQAHARAQLQANSQGQAGGGQMSPQQLQAMMAQQQMRQANNQMMPGMQNVLPPSMQNMTPQQQQHLQQMQNLTPEQRQNIMMMQQQQRQNTYSKQMAANLQARQQEAAMQGQNPGMNRPQAMPNFAGGVMAQQMQRTASHQQMQQQNSMSPHPQMPPNRPMQQGNQQNPGQMQAGNPSFIQQRMSQVEAQRAKFIATITQRNGGMPPPDAQQQWEGFRKEQMLRMSQMVTNSNSAMQQRMQQQMQQQGMSNQQQRMMAAGAGMNGQANVNSLYMQQLRQQAQQLRPDQMTPEQRQQFLARQQQQMSQMQMGMGGMNGLNNGMGNGMP